MLSHVDFLRPKSEKDIVVPQYLYIYGLCWFFPGNTVVHHSTHKPKIEGSNPAIFTGERENYEKIFVLCFIEYWIDIFRFRNLWPEPNIIRPLRP
jgi:hypothetical protein